MGILNSNAGAGLADALFTRTQLRLFTLLFGQPDRSFFATELIGLASVGRGAVQRELRRLSDSGLLTVTKLGNQKHYQADRRCPIFDELCNIVGKTTGITQKLQVTLEPVSGKIELALIYGSYAKGTDTAKSDIDLLIVSDTLTLQETFSLLAPVEAVVGRRINPSLYSIREFNTRIESDSPFMKKVLSGDHQMLIGQMVHE